jgi:hypothetical protein
MYEKKRTDLTVNATQVMSQGSGCEALIIQMILIHKSGLTSASDGSTVLPVPLRRCVTDAELCARLHKRGQCSVRIILS